MWNEFRGLQLNEEDRKSIRDHVFDSYGIVNNKRKVGLGTKLNKLMTPAVNEVRVDTQNRWFINLTTVDPPENVKNIIKLGNKFCLPIKKEEIPFDEMVASVEPKIQSLPAERRIGVRNAVCNVLNNEKAKPDIFSSSERILLDQYEDTQQFLERNKEVMLVRADKGEISVLIGRETYKEKMLQLLSNVEVYTTVINNVDHTKKIEAKVNKFITDMKKAKQNRSGY